MQICAAHRFLSREQRTICTCCALAKMVFQIMVINILYVSSELLHEIYYRWSHDLHFTLTSYLAWGCYRSQMSLWLVKLISLDIIYSLRQPWSQGLEKIILYTFCPLPTPAQCWLKHFHLTQVCNLPFSNSERGKGVVDTYSVGITIIISCFWHFPTQFVQGDVKSKWNFAWRFFSIASLNYM